MNRKLILLLLVVFVVVSSCSTKKNTASRRAYHNLTAHYNAYFNGKEALKEGVYELSNAHKDNYSQIISVFPEGNEKDVQPIVPKMERSIEKAYKVIAKHSMEFKGVEYVKWIDDSYIMIGKANFYKQDYDKAHSAFDYVTKKFSKNTERYEAYLWLARTMIAQKKLGKVSGYLSIVERASGKVPKPTIKMLPMVQADYSIKTDNYEQAVDYLKKAIELNSNKKTKVRLMFVLAQVYQKLEKNSDALEMYKNVLNKNPKYDIAFHARIFAAQCYDARKGNSTYIVKELQKMLKDKKNDDFRDEIYYALANIAFKNKNEKEGIEYLLLSAKYSTINLYQKGTTYLKLAELFFEKREYKKSQQFYDTCISVLPKDYPNYEEIKNRSEVLSELAKNIITIEREDSLQKTAAMPISERNKVIDKIIQDYERAEAQKKQEEMQRLSAINNNNQFNIANANTSWYFYNPQTVAFGKSEFRKKWGERPMEPLWRLSNKQVISFDFNNDDNLSSESDDSAKLAKNPRDRNYYMKDLPLTPEKIMLSNQKIEKAYFDLGRIYKVDLSEFKDAISTHEKLISRFDTTKYKLETWYMLYSSNKNINENARAEYYKNLIISNYPNSEFAKILTDPSYWQKIAAQKSEGEKYYENTYNLFQNGAYKDVVSHCDSAIKNLKEVLLQGRFDFLRALSYGKLYGNDSLRSRMLAVSKLYTGELKQRADDLLALLGHTNKVDEKGNIVAQKDDKPKEIYKIPSEETLHIFICIYDAQAVRANKVKADFADFNIKYFSSNLLSVSSLYLNDTRMMISISHFKSLSEGMKYIDFVKNENEMVELLKKAEPTFFIVSTDNYPAFYKSKDETKYMEFFNKNYSKNY